MWTPHCGLENVSFRPAQNLNQLVYNKVVLKFWTPKSVRKGWKVLKNF